MEKRQSFIKRSVPIWIVLVVLPIVGFCTCFIGVSIGMPRQSGKATIVAEALTLSATSNPMATFTSTNTFAPTNTFTPINSPTPSDTPTITFTPTITLTPTNTSTPTVTPNTTQTAQAKLTAQLRADKGDGFYLVNIDIAPGVWRSAGSSDGCYWATTTKTGDIIDNHFGMSGGTAFISQNAFQVELNGCGIWTFVSAP